MDVKLKKYKKTVDGNKIVFSIEFEEQPKKATKFDLAVYGESITYAAVATILKMTGIAPGHFITHPVAIYV